MERETWNDLIVFATVCEQGSFTAASITLEISPSAVSHIVKKLERRLAVRLLHRSTRSVSPTEAGKRVLADLQPAILNLNETLQLIDTEQKDISGTVKITTHRTAALYTLLPRLAEFKNAYPQVKPEIHIDDSLVDFIKSGFDAGIRRSESLSPDAIAVQIDKPVRLAYVAAPSYIDNVSPIKNVEDLLHQTCINYRYSSSKKIFPWPFILDEESIEVTVPSDIVFNDTDLLLQAAVQGCGVACVTEDQAKEEIYNGRLKRIFEEFSPLLPPNYIYYMGNKNVPAALRAFIDFYRVSP